MILLSATTRTELAYRSSDGMSLTLFWEQGDDAEKPGVSFAYDYIRILDSEDSRLRA